MLCLLRDFEAKCLAGEPATPQDCKQVWRWGGGWVRGLSAAGCIRWHVVPATLFVRQQPFVGPPSPTISGAQNAHPHPCSTFHADVY